MIAKEKRVENSIRRVALRTLRQSPNGAVCQDFAGPGD
jgi:hypothetical protein